MSQVQIKSVSHWHEQIVDWMLTNPHLPLKDCASYFDRTPTWLSTVIHSDAFEQYRAIRFAQHQERVSESVLSRVHGVADVALDVLQERIEVEREKISLDFVKDAASMALQQLGFGAKHSPAAATPSLTVHVNAAPREVLAEARDSLRRLHSSNTDESPEDAVVVSPTQEGGPTVDVEKPQLPIFGEP